MATIQELLNADAIAQGVGEGNKFTGTAFYEPQRINNFALQIPLLGQNASSADIIDFSLENFDFPKEMNDPIDVPFGNETRRVAGKVNFQELSITLKDYCDPGTAEQCRKWRQRVYNAATGFIGWAANYKCQSSLILFAPNGFAERQFTLIGMWPMDINYGTGDMNGGDYNRIEMTLSVDKVIPGASVTRVGLTRASVALGTLANGGSNNISPV